MFSFEDDRDGDLIQPDGQIDLSFNEIRNDPVRLAVQRIILRWANANPGAAQIGSNSQLLAFLQQNTEADLLKEARLVQWISNVDLSVTKPAGEIVVQLKATLNNRIAFEKLIRVKTNTGFVFVEDLPKKEV